MKEIFSNFITENFGEQVPVRRRFMNMVCIGAGLFAFFATVANLISGTGTIGLCVCIACTVFVSFALPLVKRIENLNLFAYIILIPLNFVVFPLLYITLGGIDSGMPLYFIIGVVFTILLVEDFKATIALVIFELGWYVTVMFADKHHPEISEKFCPNGSFDVYLDSSLDFLICALCIGILVKLLATSFEKQQAKTDKLLAQMEELAVKDPLTGAYNRRFLIKYLESGISNSRETGKTISIVMFDIDKFKRVNDDYGHLVGDEVIKGLATTLMNSCRDYDIVSRYGGEEFVLVLPGASEEIAIQRAETIREAFAKTSCSPLIDRPVTISGGVAEITSIMKAPEDFISVADNNLYIAKETGRNKIVAENYNK